MLKNDYVGQNCSIARALEVVGERWTLLVVRELIIKPRRFSELERRLSVAKNVLANRLEKLLELGIISREQLDEARDWGVYTLTAKGKDLFPVISALMAWGDRYSAPEGAPVIFQHSCGGAAGHKLVCEGCGEPVDIHTVHGVAGPGWVTQAPTKPQA